MIYESDPSYWSKPDSPVMHNRLKKLKESAESDFVLFRLNSALLLLLLSLFWPDAVMASSEECDPIIKSSAKKLANTGYGPHEAKIPEHSIVNYRARMSEENFETLQAQYLDYLIALEEAEKKHGAAGVVLLDDTVQLLFPKERVLPPKEFLRQVFLATTLIEAANPENIAALERRKTVTASLFRKSEKLRSQLLKSIENVSTSQRVLDYRAHQQQAIVELKELTRTTFVQSEELGELLRSIDQNLTRNAINEGALQHVNFGDKDQLMGNRLINNDKPAMLHARWAVVFAHLTLLLPRLQVQNPENFQRLKKVFQANVIEHDPFEKNVPRAEFAYMEALNDIWLEVSRLQVDAQREELNLLAKQALPEDAAMRGRNWKTPEDRRNIDELLQAVRNVPQPTSKIKRRGRDGGGRLVYEENRPQPAIGITDPEIAAHIGNHFSWNEARHMSQESKSFERREWGHKSPRYLGFVANLPSQVGPKNEHSVFPPWVSKEEVFYALKENRRFQEWRQTATKQEQSQTVITLQIEEDRFQVQVVACRRKSGCRGGYKKGEIISLFPLQGKGVLRFKIDQSGKVSRL